MDFLTGKMKPMYFKYLAAAFGSALISSIYGVVDMAMVGQYQGPEGTAALAVVSPIWNIIYSLGLLMGIGGSVLFSTLRGEAKRIWGLFFCPCSELGNYGCRTCNGYGIRFFITGNVDTF